MSGSGSGFAQFIPLILIFVIFYFFLIRPQQKKAKEHKAMVAALKRGDEVVTSGGIIGSISKVNDSKELLVEISENVEIKIAPGMVTDLYVSPDIKEHKTTSGKEVVKNKPGIFSNFLGKKEK